MTDPYSIPDAWLRKAWDDAVKEFIKYKVLPVAKKNHWDNVINSWEGDKVDLKAYQQGVYADFEKEEVDKIETIVHRLIKKREQKNEDDLKKEREEDKKKMATYSKEYESRVGILKLDNYVDNVKLFYETKPFFYDKSNMWWLWNSNDLKYEMADEVDILNEIDSELKFAGQTINTKFRANYLNAFKSVGRKNIPKDIPETWVQFKNGIYDYKTGDLIEPSPEYFSCNVIPHDIGESEDTPNMDRIFEEWVGKDRVKLLYEIIAFCMIPDYPLQRIFAFIGGGSNGKSCYLNLLKKTIGQENCASVELERLVKTFGTANLYKKLICLMGETNFDKIDKTGIIKRLSGNDLIEFEFKGKNIFSDHNYAKLIIATNSLPSSSDRTRGFYRRWIIIPFNSVFDEKKEILKEVPDQEYSNLCKKCLVILKELIERRTFDKEVSVEEKQKEYEKHSNPLLHFIQEVCIVSDNEKVPVFEFYDRFMAYLKQRSKREMSKKEVGLLMREEGFESKTVWVTDDSGNDKQWKHYFGLSFVTHVTDVTRISNRSFIEEMNTNTNHMRNMRNNTTSSVEDNEQPQDVVVPQEILNLPPPHTKSKHRKIMEKHLGRTLSPFEHVHHIDGNHENNDISNLKIMSPEEHLSLHHAGSKRKKRKSVEQYLLDILEKRKEIPIQDFVDMMEGLGKLAVDVEVAIEDGKKKGIWYEFKSGWLHKL